MPNSFGSQGLTTATQSELVANYVAGFQAIYGPNINVGPETPDGQMINLPIQTALDVENLLLQIYNSFNYQNAFGTSLDQRAAIVGIQRQAGTFTTIDITVVTSQSVNLYGLDQTAQSVYTISDEAGNQYQLQTTQLGLSPGSSTLIFSAVTPGAITPVPNTITVPVSIVLGVTSVNNPTNALTIGLNEESDAALRIRISQSVALSGQGFYNSLLAALLNIPGVTYATIIENNTGTPEAFGSLSLPGHTIWVITAGTGSPSQIANAIYMKRNAGAGMFNSGGSGAQSYNITQADGSIFTIYWDDVVGEPLYIKFNVSSINGSTPPNLPAITDPSTGLASKLMPGVNASVNANEIATLVQQIDPNSYVSNIGLGTAVDGSASIISPSTPNEQFTVAQSDIIAIPMYITSPNGNLTVSSGSVISAVSVTTLGSIQFTAYGGYSTYVWSLQTNVSGGSINSVTGAYVAGSSTGIDVVKVHDSDPAGSNVALSYVTVT